MTIKLGLLGAMRSHLKRNLDILVSSGSADFLMACLNICTAHSTKKVIMSRRLFGVQSPSSPISHKISSSASEMISACFLVVPMSSPWSLFISESSDTLRFLGRSQSMAGHSTESVSLLTLGRRVTVVVRSVCLSTAQQRAALTSRQLRYEQAKHVDGLQSDSWILLKCFRSRVMADGLLGHF